MARVLRSWLEGLRTFAEETESPRAYWRWGGLSTIASALQRKVWLQFGMDRIYPNLYVLLVGPPAQRKDAPVSFSRKILMSLGIPVSADSLSKRRFTSSLEKTSATEQFYFNGKPVVQCAISITSGEFSDMFAVNLKEMVECLTSVFDSRDVWKYETEGKGQDKLYNVCVNVLAATTPEWLLENLPQSAIGGGFSSRFIIVYSNKVYKRVTIPWVRSIEDLFDPAQQDHMESIYENLKSDLMHIHSELIGPFSWDRQAYQMFDRWYQKVDTKLTEILDDRLRYFIGRMHTMVLKTAMILRADYSDELLLTPPDVEAAIEFVEEVLHTAGEAFEGHGRSKTGPDTQRVMQQLRVLKIASFKELIKLNYKHLNKTELQGVLGTIESMGLVKVTLSIEFPEGRFLWMGK